jgi:hypothetical protein
MSIPKRLVSITASLVRRSAPTAEPKWTLRGRLLRRLPDLRRPRSRRLPRRRRPSPRALSACGWASTPARPTWGRRATSGSTCTGRPASLPVATAGSAGLAATVFPSGTGGLRDLGKHRLQAERGPRCTVVYQRREGWRTRRGTPARSRRAPTPYEGGFGDVDAQAFLVQVNEKSTSAREIVQGDPSRPSSTMRVRQGSRVSASPPRTTLYPKVEGSNPSRPIA